mmetsp:Transcript_12897/g.33114  ORF Transcript_12897/g.33114 Transcript_12897/m.33114 type:complete len:121 (-) Transcript_12897:493-855(-)
MENIQPTYEALLAAVAEVVAIKSLYNPGATLEAEQAKLQQCWTAFNHACDAASLQLEGAKAHLLREQANSIRANAGPDSGIDAQTAAALEAKTQELHRQLRQGHPDDVKQLEGAVKTEGQ